MAKESQNFLLENDLKEIDTRTNPATIQYKLYSAYVNLLLSHKYFQTNADIKELTNKLDFELKDYVFKSRTLLIARFMKKIQTLDSEQILLFLSVAKEIVQENGNGKISKRAVTKTSKKLSAIDKFGRS
ncbi:hypothetical protein KB1253_26390 [Lactiplantibacillus plantarum]|uniref:hypothetical protein n=1 Tax=Lactiplantibacillus TaxID=2767842 RepID=UPI000FD8CB56|nr:hypothetical protein [Lactiplantibacillus plantarum]GCD87481.1 hypothetical protein KB1253_26390 [Lactiplantibacillus plantarum]